MHKKTSKDKVGIREEIIGLYHTIDSLMPDITCPIIQFIGSHTGEGVSTISREFARIAAGNFGRSVLLLDAAEDLSEGSQGRQPTGPAETDHAAGETLEENKTASTSSDKSAGKDVSAFHICLETPYNFHLGSFQEAGTSVSVAFSCKYYREYATLLCQSYDLVLIDSPPLSQSSISLAIASKVDGVVLIVAAETTRWPVAERVKSRIKEAGGNVLGLVLNKQKHYIPRLLYRHFL